MVRVATRLRICFWLIAFFLVAQSVLLLFYSRRSIRRSSEALDEASRSRVECAETLSQLHTSLAVLVEWVHDFEDARATQADAPREGRAPPSLRVEGWGQNKHYLYADIRVEDGEEVRRERRYIRKPSSPLRKTD